MQTEDYCPGSRDFRTIRERKGAFEGEDDIQLVGFINCGGCPGKKAVLRARSLVSHGADTIAFASCIPMQKEACRNFAESQGWEIVKEFSEKGVSGFKKSAKERDELQKVQQAAMEGKFDILLVFMFDRLGRRDDETPFIVEWFTKQGIEVWSVNEGQQRFDTHVDKLMNYIRYWQASGESLKTSVRTRTRLEQLTGEGHYTGGTVAFGYKRVRLGRVNKKNQEVCDLVIDEAEAEIVRLIFHKYVYEGYGAQKLSHYLYEQGVVGRNNKNIPNTSIVRMIKNKGYHGVPHQRCGGDGVSAAPHH